MLIYLKHDKHTVCVKDITIKDGCIPVVSDSVLVLPGTKEQVQLDPSLWYKTLLVQAVYIDCSQREVKWTRAYIGDLTEVKRPSSINDFFPVEAEPLNGDTDVYDFDPKKDEFIDRAIEVMTGYCAKKLNEEQFRVDVAQLLHCFILPLLQFNRADIPELENVLSYIEDQHERIELQLLKKTEELQRTENALQKQRERILLNEQCDSERYIWSCQRDFLIVFLNHVEKDIDNVNKEFDELSENINCLKKEAKGDDVQQTISQQRESRNKVLEWLVKLQTARETIKNVVVRPVRTKKNKYRKKKIKENIIHNIYLELARRAKQQKDEIQNAVMKKVRMSSVREAVYGVILSLRHSSEDSSPVETADGSEYSLEIIGLQSKPADWDTLEEKVTHQLTDLTSGVYAEHIHGYQMIHDLIQASLNEISMFGVHVTTSEYNWQLVSLKNGEVLNQASEVTSAKCESEPVNDCNRLLVNNVESALENIKERFKSHMDEVCEMLMKSITSSAHYKSKIWVVYDNFLSPECLPAMEKLYRYCVTPSCQKVHGMMSTLPLSEVVYEDQFITNLLEKNCSLNDESGDHLSSAVDSCVADNRPVSDVSVLSLEMKKYSLEELYSMADKDCSRLEKHLDSESPHLEDKPNNRGESSSGSSTNLTSSGGEDDMDADDVATGTVSEDSVEEVDQKAVLSEMFVTTRDLLRSFIRAKTVMDKLRKLTQVYRDVGRIISAKVKDQGLICCDKMLSMIIALLWCSDAETFISVYTNIKMLLDIMPGFLSGHVHDCSLTNFYAAFQVLFDTECLRR